MHAIENFTWLAGATTLGLVGTVSALGGDDTAQQIAELGARLFNRGRRETTLTPAGETLRDHAEALLTQAAGARRAVGDLVAMKGGRLAVGAIPSVSACLLPAAVAAFHPKWDERPVLVIVPRAGHEPTRDELLGFLAPRMAKWWLPDDIVFVSEMPMTATGKILKAKLREQYWHRLGK